MELEAIRDLCQDATIVMTQHMALRCRERGIVLDDIKQAIMQGEMIEDYPTDYPYPSCLILGGPLHVVCGIGGGLLWIITAYYPSADKWETDHKTRKGKSL